MSVEANKALVARFFDEAINERKLEILDEILAPHFAGNKLEHENTSSTRAELKAALANVFVAFPDYHQTIVDWIAEGEKVVARWITRGTHQGPYNGIPPTGRVILEHGIDIFRVVDGQIVEHWVELDLLGILHQMGVVTPLSKG